MSLIFNKIKVILAERNLQFTELAEYVGMTQQGLRLSLKRKKTSFEAIKRIAEYLSTSPEYLLNEDDEIENRGIGPKQIESIGKLKNELHSKNETILFLKDKVNDLYNLYWSFQLSLNEEDTARLYKNDKLHKFEMGFIFTIQEILSMIAETKEERERLHSLIEVASEKVVAVASNDRSAMKRILLKRENLLKAITGPDLIPAWSFKKKTDEGKDNNETTEEKNTAGQKEK